MDEGTERQCTDIYDDQRPTKCRGVAEKRSDGTEATRRGCACPGLTSDLVIRARSGMSRDKAAGLENIIVTDMVQRLSTEVPRIM